MIAAVLALRRFALFAALAATSASLACATNGATAVPEGASATVISLQNIDCQSCGTKVVDTLTARPGVYAAEFDRTLAEVSVRFDDQVTGFDDFKADIESHGYLAFEGAGQGAYLPEVIFPAELDMVKISEEGEDVALEANLVGGKVTVFDYYAVWCKPCREIDGHMKGVLAESPDVALRKLNVVDWDSPVAKTHLQGIPSLPYIIVYDTQGKRVAEISGLHIEELDAAIEKGRNP